MIPNRWYVCHLGKDQPNVDHLDISRLRKAVGHADEQGGEDEKGGHVHRDYRFKEKGLEEVGGIDNDENEHCGQIDSQDRIQDSSLEDDRHLDAGVNITGVVVGQRPVGDQVLSEHRLRLHGDDVWGDLHH